MAEEKKSKAFEDGLEMRRKVLGPDYVAFLEPGSAVRRRTTPGGAGPEPVARELVQARERIERQQTWLAH